MSRIYRFGWMLLPAVVLLASAGAAHAASRSIGDRIGRPGGGDAAARVVHRLPASMGGSARYVYAEDGSCPDGIDVFQASGTGLSFLQHVQVGCTYGAYAGVHYLAVVTDPTDCLVFSDVGDQDLDSFTIDPSTGLLSSAPVSSVHVNGSPLDLAVSGSMVFASEIFSSAPYGIDVLTVGAGCSLTLDSENTESGDEYAYEIALPNPTTVVSCDEGHGEMLAFTLQANDTLVQTVASPDELCGGTGMVATNAGTQALAFTGGDTSQGTQLDGFDFDGSEFTPLPGSPQKVRNDGARAYAVALSLPDRLLLQSQQGPDSDSQLVWDTLADGSMRYGGTTPLPADTGPVELTVAGNVLLVADLNDNLMACSLAPSGVSDCRVVATLTDPDPGHSNSGSTAIF